uniref:Uncharacterized protein n=1 Tax=Anguilla anguilla TaxID=7936 RepID=A0A0E9RFP0_ANGAN
MGSEISECFVDTISKQEMGEEITLVCTLSSKEGETVCCKCANYLLN